MVRNKPIAIAGLALCLLPAAGCRADLVVRLATTLHHDGSLTRVVEVRGRGSDGEVPGDPDWLADTAGVRLARPDGWDRVESGPGWLRAEGFFLTAEELPGLLAFGSPERARAGRVATRVDVEDRVVLKRWVFSERHGDPYTRADAAAAADALIELVAEALRHELARHFGEELDPAPAEAFLRGEGRALAGAMLAAGRAAPGWERMQRRAEQWNDVLLQAGLPVDRSAPADDYWDAQLPAILGWARERVAVALSTEKQPVLPADLAFWPTGDDWEEQASAIVQRVWGGDDELLAHVEPLLPALVGFYGDDDAPRMRFEQRLAVPGVLLRTNGTPDGDAVLWIFREQELNYGEVVLRAESVERQAEPLTAMGARRELERADLLRLADLLFRQDPEGLLVEVLRRAVRDGSLEPLRDEQAVPEALQPTAGELADLLDPARPREPPL